MGIEKYYRKELQRAAWRLQYNVKSKRKRECMLGDITHQPSYSPFEETDSRLLVQQLLNEIPPSIGKKIIRDLFLKNKTELQLAKELNMSQQAVNKWKRKTLHLLLQKMSS
ncbi:hypothetical protein [Paenibacillus sp. OK076]|uniref:hypothetical protein n=1 Tax=Paenibacillus sp. OK076 TaxID=1884379 RepID=UPI0008C0E973|nr:hypothetical protein [Paenibacillus sp. OK076]SEP33575.1 hypothetical protein SAMN05518670_6607 [Paenibacillus sp. OK076]